MEIEKIFATLTLGCKVNQYETEAMAELFKKSGYREQEDVDSYADVYIINTCTVTNLSDRKSRQMIRRAKRENPESVVAVVGCYSQVSPSEVAEISGVDIVLGTKDRNKIVQYCEKFIEEKKQIIAVDSIKRFNVFQDIHISTQEDMTRAYLKVQDGCNQFCSYCIIPFARGPIRSRALEDAYQQALELGKAGFQEIILTGIHIGSYGKDLENTSLIDIIERIAEIPAIKRIRLSSIEPQSITEDFMKRATAINKVCDHFHLSLQNGSNEILRAMNRRYTVEEYFEKTTLIRSYMPFAGITTDIIVGFPGESERNFMDTVEFVKKVGFSRIHVFKYSPRKGTKAAIMKEQISGKIKQERSSFLISLGEKISEEFIRKNLNRELEVLFEEKHDKDNYQGYTSNYIRVEAESESDLKNCVKRVMIKEKTLEPVKVTLIES